MQELGRTLILLGIALATAGVCVLLFARVGLPLGKLPGDIAYRGRNFSFFAPLGSSLLLSLVLSLLLYLLARLRR